MIFANSKSVILSLSSATNSHLCILFYDLENLVCNSVQCQDVIIGIDNIVPVPSISSIESENYKATKRGIKV